MVNRSRLRKLDQLAARVKCPKCEKCDADRSSDPWFWDALSAAEHAEAHEIGARVRRRPCEVCGRNVLDLGRISDADKHRIAALFRKAITHTDGRAAPR